MREMTSAEARTFAELGHASGRAHRAAPFPVHRGGQRLRARRRLRARAGVRLHLRERQGQARAARGQPGRHPRLRRDPAARAARRHRPRAGALLHGRRHPGRRSAAHRARERGRAARGALAKVREVAEKIASKGPLGDRAVQAGLSARRGRAAHRGERARGTGVRGALRERRSARRNGRLHREAQGHVPGQVAQSFTLVAHAHVGHRVGMRAGEVVLAERDRDVALAVDVASERAGSRRP